MLASGLAQELNAELSSMEGCVHLAQRYAFRTHRPCSDGSYPGLLFKSVVVLITLVFPMLVDIYLEGRTFLPCPNILPHRCEFMLWRKLEKGRDLHFILVRI